MDSPTNNGEPPFPHIDSGTPNPNAVGASSPTPPHNPPDTSASSGGRLRRVSQSFGTSELPGGFSAATGGIASTIFSRQAQPKPGPTSVSDAPVFHEISTETGASSKSSSAEKSTEEPCATAPFANGYHFPPSHSFGHATKLSLIAFWKYFTTPLGFVVTIYGLNIVAWGGMLFLLMCNASPAMCYPSCNARNSPRKKWIEWNSQTLNALFCVTGLGLAPWRFRDLYFLLQYRLLKKPEGLRRLAGVHRGWFRLPGSETLPVDLGPQNISQRVDAADSVSVPYPETMIPDPPLTGVRARASRVWMLDLVVWLMVWNTFFQICLCVFMWSFNRHDRPNWATGLFVALACIVAGVGGYLMFLEGKAVKGIEGVPVSQEDLEKLERDRSQGIYHFNNIKDKNLEAKEAKKEDKAAGDA